MTKKSSVSFSISVKQKIRGSLCLHGQGGTMNRGIHGKSVSSRQVYQCTTCKNRITAYARITILVQTHARRSGYEVEYKRKRADLLSVYVKEEKKRETLLRILKISNYPPVSCH